MLQKQVGGWAGGLRGWDLGGLPLLEDFTIKNSFVSPIMMAELESKYNLVGLPSISMLIDLDGRVSRAMLESKTMDDLAKMIVWGMVWHSITINTKVV